MEKAELYEPEDNLESAYIRKIARLEILAQTLADRDNHPVLYSLIIDYLGIKPQNSTLYEKGREKRIQLEEKGVREKRLEIMAGEYSDENEAHITPMPVVQRSASHRRAHYTPPVNNIITREQLERCRGIISYYNFKRINPNGCNQLQDRIAFLRLYGREKTNHCRSLRTREGEGGFTKLEDCDPAVICEASNDIYNRALKKREAYDRGEIQLENGTHAEDMD